MHDASGRPVYRLDMGWRGAGPAAEYDGEECHGPEQAEHDRARRAELEVELGWTVLVATRGEVLGRSMALERALGGLLGMEPRISRRAW